MKIKCLIFCLIFIAMFLELPALFAAPVKATKSINKNMLKQTPAKQPSNSSSNSLTPAYNSYINSIKPKVGANWNFPDGKNHVQLTVQIASDGSVSNLNMISSPNNGEAEQRANDALNAAQPLPPLPSGSPPVRMTISFDSNADPHGDSQSNFAIKIDPVAQASSQTSDQNNKSEKE